MKEKAVITAAITGSIHTPTMSEYLPITPQQIADEAVRAYEAGAAVCHVHARNPETGMPVPDCESDERDYHEDQEPVQHRRLHHNGRRNGHDRRTAGGAGYHV